MSRILDILNVIILQKNEEIEQWFSEQYAKTEPFFYSSVDLRHSGNKLVPVDTNLFPAGFNLLSQKAIENASAEARRYFDTHLSNVKNILIIPENHTRNLSYLDNIAAIDSLLTHAGFHVKIGGMTVEEEALTLESASGVEIKIHPIIRAHETLSIEGFTPDAILVNNDLSAGAPEILTNIKQPVIPPVGMGWYRRRKTSHFDSYANISRIFANQFDFDPWLISSSFTKCGTINFKDREGLECVARNVEKALFKIQKKYDHYKIKDEPYVFIKADSGTYGMGIMTVKSPEEVFEINKKSRNKMNVVKEGVINSEVIIQEGIPTIDRVDGKVAEPMIYMINATPIGCTMRINDNRDDRSNLNSSGMTFKSACSSDGEAKTNNNVCPAQALIARLASLAATYECYESNWDI